jgi:hypothetical protein
MHKYCWKWNQIIRRLFFVQYTRHILKLQNPSPVEYLRVRSWYQVQTGYLRVLSRYQIQRRILRTTTRIINTSTDHHSGGFSVCPSDTVKFTTAYIKSYILRLLKINPLRNWLNCIATTMHYFTSWKWIWKMRDWDPQRSWEQPITKRATHQRRCSQLHWLLRISIQKWGRVGEGSWSGVRTSILEGVGGRPHV